MKSTNKKFTPAVSSLPENPMSKILVHALNNPGILSKCYSQFHTYSLMNTWSALWQMFFRNIEVGPIASFNAWKNKDRMVKKGEKAIELCMPITSLQNEKQETINEKGEKIITEGKKVIKFFVWKKNWFALSQTEGKELSGHDFISPKWNPEQALKNLDIIQEPYNSINGNCQGYAKPGIISVSPVAAFPHKTRFHEIAHNVLGHCKKEDFFSSDTDYPPKNIREVEAECTTYILLDMLDLPGREESRGYIQNWLQDSTIDENTVKKIFSAAQKIFDAGKPQETEPQAS